MLLFEPLWTFVFSDLKRLPRDERRTVIRAALRAVPVHRSQMTLAGWSAGMLVFIGSVALATARSVLSFSLILLLGIAALWILYPLERWWRAVSERSTFRRDIRRQMTERGHPACVECGYDLRAASGQRCSECGHPLPLMRFRVGVSAAGKGSPENWEVTALSAAHARALLLDRFTLERRASGEILSVQQVVCEHIERSGSIALMGAPSQADADVMDLDRSSPHADNHLE